MAILMNQVCMSLGNFFSRPDFTARIGDLEDLLQKPSLSRISEVFWEPAMASKLIASELSEKIPMNREVDVGFSFTAQAERKKHFLRADEIHEASELFVYVRDARSKIDIHMIPIAWERMSYDGSPQSGLRPSEGALKYGDRQVEYTHRRLGEFVPRSGVQKSYH